MNNFEKHVLFDRIRPSTMKFKIDSNDIKDYFDVGFVQLCHFPKDKIPFDIIEPKYIFFYLEDTFMCAIFKGGKVSYINCGTKLIELGEKKIIKYKEKVYGNRYEIDKNADHRGAIGHALSGKNMNYFYYYLSEHAYLTIKSDVIIEPSGSCVFSCLVNAYCDYSGRQYDDVYQKIFSTVLLKNNDMCIKRHFQFTGIDKNSVEDDIINLFAAVSNKITKKIRTVEHYKMPIETPTTYHNTEPNDIINLCDFFLSRSLSDPVVSGHLKKKYKGKKFLYANLENTSYASWMHPDFFYEYRNDKFISDYHLTLLDISVDFVSAVDELFHMDMLENLYSSDSKKDLTNKLNKYESCINKFALVLLARASDYKITVDYDVYDGMTFDDFCQLYIFKLYKFITGDQSNKEVAEDVLAGIDAIFENNDKLSPFYFTMIRKFMEEIKIAPFYAEKPLKYKINPEGKIYKFRKGSGLVSLGGNPSKMRAIEKKGEYEFKKEVIFSDKSFDNVPKCEGVTAPLYFYGKYDNILFPSEIPTIHNVIKPLLTDIAEVIYIANGNTVEVITDINFKIVFSDKIIVNDKYIVKNPTGESIKYVNGMRNTFYAEDNNGNCYVMLIDKLIYNDDSWFDFLKYSPDKIIHIADRPRLHILEINYTKKYFSNFDSDSLIIYYIYCLFYGNYSMFDYLDRLVKTMIKTSEIKFYDVIKKIPNIMYHYNFVFQNKWGHNHVVVNQFPRIKCKYENLEIEPVNFENSWESNGAKDKIKNFLSKNDLGPGESSTYNGFLVRNNMKEINHEIKIIFECELQNVPGVRDITIKKTAKYKNVLNLCKADQKMYKKKIMNDDAIDDVEMVVGNVPQEFDYETDYGKLIANCGSNFVYDPQYKHAAIIFNYELLFGFFIKYEQYKLIKCCIEKMIVGKNYIYQMIMGGGKTTVIIPIISIILWNEGKKVAIVQPIHLVPQMLNIFYKNVLPVHNINIFTKISDIHGIYIISDVEMKHAILDGANMSDFYVIYDEIDDMADNSKSELNIVVSVNKNKYATNVEAIYDDYIKSGTDQINRLHYGFDLERETKNHYIALPFISNNKPSKLLTFSDINYCIRYTIDALNQLIDLPAHFDEKFNEYKARDLNNCFFSDTTKEKIKNITWKNKKDFIIYFVTRAIDEFFILSEEVKRISFVDLMSNHFIKNKIGFSGTPFLLTEDSMCKIIFQKNAIQYMKNVIKDATIQNVSSFNGNYVLIDAGAKYIDYTSDQLAEKEFKGKKIIYINRQNEIMIYDGIKHEKSFTNDFSNDDVSIIFDEGHLTGVDIKISDNVTAYVTFNDKMYFSKMVQAIFRLRNATKLKEKIVILTDEKNIIEMLINNEMTRLKKNKYFHYEQLLLLEYHKNFDFNLKGDDVYSFVKNKIDVSVIEKKYAGAEKLNKTQTAENQIGVFAKMNIIIRQPHINRNYANHGDFYEFDFDNGILHNFITSDGKIKNYDRIDPGKEITNLLHHTYINDCYIDRHVIYQIYSGNLVDLFSQCKMVKKNTRTKTFAGVNYIFCSLQREGDYEIGVSDKTISILKIMFMSRSALLRDLLIFIDFITSPKDLESKGEYGSLKLLSHDAYKKYVTDHIIPSYQKIINPKQFIVIGLLVECFSKNQPVNLLKEYISGSNNHYDYFITNITGSNDVQHIKKIIE